MSRLSVSVSPPCLAGRLLLSAALDPDGSAVRRHARRAPGRHSRRGARLRFGGRARSDGGSGGTQGRVFPRDAFEEVADPALLLLLRVGQQEQLLGRRHVVVHWRGDLKRLEPLAGVLESSSGS